MWRDWVHTPSEVHVVWEVECLTVPELLGDTQEEEETTPETVCFLVLLMLLDELQLLPVVGPEDHLWCDAPLVEAAWDGTQSSTDGPQVFDNVQDLVVNGPFLLTQDVEDSTDGSHVAFLQVFDSLSESWVDFGDPGLPQVVASKVIALPIGWLIDHWQTPIQLEIQIVRLV